MIRNVLLASVVAAGALALVAPADLSAATADESSSEFRDALFSTCDGQSRDAEYVCMRGRTIVFDRRNADARQYLQGCLNAGQSQAECVAKQRKYWNDLKEMFGL